MTEQARLDDCAGDVTCKQAATLFCEGRDRELSSAEQQSLHVHIQGCTACQVASRQLSAVFAQLRQFVDGS